MKSKGSAHVLLGEGSGKIWTCSCWEKGNLIMINEFKYGQTWKIRPSPLTLSLYNPFKKLCPWCQFVENLHPKFQLEAGYLVVFWDLMLHLLKPEEISYQGHHTLMFAPNIFEVLLLLTLTRFPCFVCTHVPHLNVPFMYPSKRSICNTTET